jgi:membrane dipeptidase
VRRLAAWDAQHPNPGATLAQVADHIDHIRACRRHRAHRPWRRLRWHQHDVVTGLEDVSRYPALLAELATRGYSDADIAAIAGGNVLRVMESAESVAREIQETRDAADLLIEAASGD